ncbi:MAG: alpha/beta hydrolase [Actinomycetia bacterium]|nr:alpha/beta hydrolase [Actinomycetes bacterium]
MRVVGNPSYASETQALLDKIGPVGPLDYPTLVAGRAEDPDPAYAGTPDPRVTIAAMWVPVGPGPAPVRVYAGPPDQPRPLLLWLHGGGFVGGAACDLDATCAALALAARVTVVSLDYRLAPEHPYPAALDDCVDAVGWLAEHGRALRGDGRLVIGGQSAGGNLAAAACLRVHREGCALVDAQVLCYPVLDFGRQTESARLFNGVFLDISPGRWEEHAYLAGQQPDEYAAPLRAPSLAGLPPALVIGAGRDPLRDHAREYVARLHAADVDVEHVEYDATMHAFLNFPAVLSAASHAVDMIATYLNQRRARRGLRESVP